MGLLCKRATLPRHGGRVLVTAHRKELISQNRAAIEQITGKKCGVYSAGLDARDTENEIIVAGIQSVYKRGKEFGRRDLVIVDEAHLISDDEDSMYQQLFSAFPGCRVPGLTATPFRTSTGPIAGPDKPFRKIVYERRVGEMINEDFLCRLTNKPLQEIDTSDVKIRAGEFQSDSLESQMISENNVRSACEQIVSLTRDRSSVVVFCCGVDHVYAVRDRLESLTDEPVGAVTGETVAVERANMLNEFCAGRLKYIINCDILSVGFDSARISCVVSLRPTLSPGLWAQQVGRGLRKHPEKTDCLILDFGGNTARHGSLDAPDYGRATIDAQDAQARAAAKNSRGWSCPSCNDDVAIELESCHCGYERPKCDSTRKSHHSGVADQHSDLIGSTPKRLEVLETRVRRHEKAGKPPSMKVIYLCRPIGSTGNLHCQMVFEWVCFEHDGYAREKAATWWKARSSSPVPETVSEALQRVNHHQTISPTVLTVIRDGQFDRITYATFQDDKPTQDDKTLLDLPFSSDYEVPF